MRRAPGWLGALRTSVSCLPVNAALVVRTHLLTGPWFGGSTLSAERGRRLSQDVSMSVNADTLSVDRLRRMVSMRPRGIPSVTARSRHSTPIHLARCSNMFPFTTPAHTDTSKAIRECKPVTKSTNYWQKGKRCSEGGVLISLP